MDETRIYVAVAGTVQVPPRHIIQPPGRQIAQAAHVVSKLRWKQAVDLTLPNAPWPLFYPITTIILQARDSAELAHIMFLMNKEKMDYVMFCDTNPEYGLSTVVTAIAVFATKMQITGILDYLPLWGSK